MVKETIRMVCDALQHETYGVNIFLDDMESPNVASFGDETRDNEVAMRSPKEPFPSLSVTLAEPLALEGEVMTSYRDGTDLTLSISYMGRDELLAQANSDMWDTMRATQRCFRRWLLNENAADRQLDGIQVIACTGMEVTPPLITPEDSLIPGAMLIRFRVRDISP